MRYRIEEHSQGTLRVFNMMGELVKTFISEAQISGEQSMILDLSSLPNGLYLVKLQVGDKTATTRIIVLR